MARLGDRSPSTILRRRSFLIGSAGAALAFAFGDVADASQVFPPSKHDTGDTSFAPTMWYSIDPDGIVTINIIRAEMGQHVGTSLARILADELEVDWTNVRINHVDTDPKWGLMVTGGSWSVFQTYPIFSKAGAAGRLALIERGAELLSVPVDTCVARDGAVASGVRWITYGEIVKAGINRSFTPEQLDALPIKAPAKRRLIGRKVDALDIPQKIDGTARYGIDAHKDGMVYARPILPPTRYGSKVIAVDDSAARNIKGYLSAVILNDPSDTVPGWVMAIAKTYPAAIKAADAIVVQWESGPTASISEADLQNRSRELIADPSTGSILDTGDTDTEAVFKTASRTFEQTYTNATALHFQLEPTNALAFEENGTFEIHTGNQWQTLILPTLAIALGRSEPSIVMRSYMLGGGFGRRLNGDYAVPAALAAKALGKPVKMILTREDECRFDSARSPAVQTLRMAFSAEGEVIAMEHHAAAGWPTEVLAPSFMPMGGNGVPYDPFSINGADHWYEVGAQKVRAISNDLAKKTFRPGWLRSVGPGWTNWALESFMDEAAHEVGKDPVEFRLSLLKAAGRNAGVAPNSVGGAARQHHVVETAAARAGWGEKLPANHGLGIATSFGQEREMPTWVACVAHVEVDRTTGEVRVHKLTSVVDAGTIVDPGGAMAQVEGATLWGLSLALFEGTQFVNGQVEDRNLDTYTPLRIGGVPKLDVTFVETSEPPTGLGEPPTTVVGPAIANAIFAAVGIRLRHIPIRPDAVLNALSS
ncbi:xanthine dehydrogenase family protein molybdopterin-binding subunit [Rhizobium mesosinicum]|uniref:Xanthine dehydrogenase family protein molybdopterin-binding subunit n=1 Tax=Rhizobium mesosinicum TaxID=335017 RepID=A0ABS7GM29_9HYPH|nr:molybdopterin cofactor-binding domain-containing protein [Rhizobium mesosinicum]MBW9051045.1 xanthine dehydrogenase family protein molybdopterin-binding subunit [Rhizobium mesosinicum]